MGDLHEEQEGSSSCPGRVQCGGVRQIESAKKIPILEYLLHSFLARLAFSPSGVVHFDTTLNNTIDMRCAKPKLQRR